MPIDQINPKSNTEIALAQIQMVLKQHGDVQVEQNLKLDSIDRALRGSNGTTGLVARLENVEVLSRTNADCLKTLQSAQTTVMDDEKRAKVFGSWEWFRSKMDVILWSLVGALIMALLTVTGVLNLKVP